MLNIGKNHIGLSTIFPAILSSALTFLVCYYYWYEVDKVELMEPEFRLPCPTIENATRSANICQREKDALQACKDKKVEQLQINRETLLLIAKEISQAHRHTRSGVAMHLLASAFTRVSTLAGVAVAALETERLQLANLTEPLDVCPETWLAWGMKTGKFDFPKFEKGYEIVNCTSVKPFSDVLSIALDAVYDNNTAANLNDIVGIIRGKYPNLTILVAVPKNSADFATLRGNITFLPVDAKVTNERAVWTELVKNVSTPYVLIGRRINYFDWRSFLERLVRLLSYTNADVVGGAYRDFDGKWYAGCMQLSLKNYTLKLIEGYDLSYNSCMYCDYIAGPFAARKSFLLTRLKDIVSSGREAMWLELFTDHFLLHRPTALVCADVMFYSSHVQLGSLARNDWLPLVKKYEINRLVFADKSAHKFSCSESGSSCSWTSGKISPVCCNEALSDSLRFMVQLFEQNNILVEGWQGNLMGTVKFQSILPWERDGDFIFHMDNYTAIKALIPKFKEAGYQLEPDKSLEHKNISVCSTQYSYPCGYFAFRVGGSWRTELRGHPGLMSQKSFPKPPTKIACNDFWHVVCPNPGRCVRNEYGDDIFEHLEHSMHLPSGEKNVYSVGFFNKCYKPGFHACLDNYLPVGNLQFRDP